MGVASDRKGLGPGEEAGQTLEVVVREATGEPSRKRWSGDWNQILG